MAERHRRAAGLRVLAGLVASFLAACATAPAPGAAPWGVADSDLRSQRLYKVQYAGERGRGSGRLTLYLEAPRRYELAAADAFGSPLWSLRVDGERGLFVEPRAGRACRLSGSVDLPDLPLAPLPLAAVPALLLGRLPVAAPEPAAAAGEVRDERGRRFTYAVAGGRLASWTLWRQDAPALWWRRAGAEAVLSSSAGGYQLRWREVAREPLRRAPAGVELEDGTVAGECP